MSLIRALTDNAKKEKGPNDPENEDLIWLSKYSINTESWFASYWQFSLDVDAFIEKIKNQSVIAELDSTTKQNIFHYLLLNNPFKYDTHGRQYHISKKDMPGLLSSINDNGLPWSAFHENYKKFRAEYKIKMVDTVAEENKKRILDALLEPYKNDDDALMRVLLSRDNNDNTVLFTGYNHYLNDIKPMFIFVIAGLKLKRILLQKNLFNYHQNIPVSELECIQQPILKKQSLIMYIEMHC